MKRIAGAFVVFLALGGWALVAQEKTEVAVSKAEIGAERKAIVTKNVELSPQESAAFWRVYDEYRTAMQQVEEKRLRLIQRFAEEYQKLTDEQALAMLDDYFGFREAKVNLQKAYVARFGKVLPGRKVARYYQVENLIDTMVDYDLTRAIPLIK